MSVNEKMVLLPALKTKPDYRVLFSGSLENLERQVQEFLAKGWKCQGGICISSEENCYQAMIKE